MTRAARQWVAGLGLAVGMAVGVIGLAGLGGGGVARERAGCWAQEAAGDPNEAVLLFNEAMGEYAQRRLQPARTRLEEIIRRFPKHPLAARARLELARVCKDQREFDRAIEVLTGLVTDETARSEFQAAREMLLDLLFDLHRYKAGLDLLEKWWQENPGDVEIGRRLARFYLSAGKPDEARLLLEGLLERTARPDVFNDLLQMAIRQGRVEGLRTLIEQRRARYRTVDYLDFVSDCHLALKETEKAATLLREAKETAGELRLLRKLAQIDLGRNDPARALESLRRLQKMFPDQWEYAKAAGRCLFLLGRKEEAVREWREHFQKRGALGTEGFQLLIEVFIEHQLYEEALAVFAEARQLFGNPTMFAEEKAGVLEALGRRYEALAEYFLTLVNGVYKTEVFDKLYENRSPEFDLAALLKGALRATPTLAVRRALIEMWFRDGDAACLPDLLQLTAGDGNVQELVYERIRQESFTHPTPFLRAVILGLIKQERAGSLGLRLQLILLTLPDQTDAQAEEALAEASATAALPAVADVGLLNRLLVEMARLAWERFARVEPALAWLGRVTGSPTAAATPGAAFEAWLMTMRLQASLGNFPAADEALSRARQMAVGLGGAPRPGVQPQLSGGGPSGSPVFEGYNPEDEFDALFDLTELGPEAAARLLYEEGWLLAQKGQFQEALDKLRELTTQHPESMWMNDGLHLALTLTMGSVGDLEPLKKYLAAERAASVGSTSTALALWNEVASVASETAFGRDARARALLVEAEFSPDPSAVLKEVEGFVRLNPTHWLAPDLWIARGRLLRETGAAPEALADHYKEFLDRYPGDLRARRAKLALADLMRAKAAQGKQ